MICSYYETCTCCALIVYMYSITVTAYLADGWTTMYMYVLTVTALVGRWLGYNDIPELHADDFCVLTSMYELHLSGNELTEETTPEDVFGCLTALTIL